jgi:hypothetical protein
VLDDGGDLIIVDRARSARTIFIQKAFDAVLQKAPPPFADGMFVHAQLGGDDFAG